MDVKLGCIIEKVDGIFIKKGEDYFLLFEGKVGCKVLFFVYDFVIKKCFEEIVKVISYGVQCELLYKCWVECNCKKVEELLGGCLGYVYIKGMDS